LLIVEVDVFYSSFIIYPVLDLKKINASGAERQSAEDSTTDEVDKRIRLCTSSVYKCSKYY